MICPGEGSSMLPKVWPTRKFSRGQTDQQEDWRRLFEGVTGMFSDEDLVTIKTETVAKIAVKH